MSEQSDRTTDSGQDHKHIVKAYDEELGNLKNMTLRLGVLSGKHIERSIDAVLERDPLGAQEVVDGDEVIDELEREIQGLSFRTLSLRQPTSIDLRTIVTAQKIATYLERIGDYATNIAKRAAVLDSFPPVDPVKSIVHLSRHVTELVSGVMKAYYARDEELALAVWFGDEKIDNLYTALLREILTYMMEDPRTITPCTHVLFIARNLERIGDHAANIAESVFFLITGEMPLGDRPKPDTWENSPSQDGPA
jgi:phosphate transport system protein